jgi:hypothetical protein
MMMMLALVDYCWDCFDLVWFGGPGAKSAARQRVRHSIEERHKNVGDWGEVVFEHHRLLGRRDTSEPALDWRTPFGAQFSQTDFDLIAPLLERASTYRPATGDGENNVGRQKQQQHQQ